jgi:hypothetical protein
LNGARRSGQSIAPHQRVALGGMGDGIIRANGTAFRVVLLFLGYGNSPGDVQIMRDSSIWRKNFRELGANRQGVGTLWDLACRGRSKRTGCSILTGL